MAETPDKSSRPAMKKDRALNIKIERTEQNDNHTVYVLDITSNKSEVKSTEGQSSWVVKRRFREFHSLHSQLRGRVYYKKTLPAGPAKKTVGAMDPAFVEERRGLLQAYLDTLMTIPIVLEDEAVCDFLDLARKNKSSCFETPEKAGWLQKQGKWNPAWKRRYFKAKDGFIYYFRDDKEPQPLGTISMEGTTVQPCEKKEFAFGVFHPRLRDYFLAAESEQERQQWLSALQSPDAHVGISDFTLLTVLGKGSFGKVLRVKRNSTGELFAMKVLRKTDVRAQHQVEHTRTERQLLQRVSHPFLVELKFAFQTDEKLYMVLDYVAGGELFMHLKKDKRFDEPRARFYAAEVCLALEYLHTLNFIYRDLKPENLLLNNDGHIKITDFGLSKNISRASSDDRATYTFCGTPEYMAPEVLTEQGHGKAVDWWSLGILIYEMLVGLPPFYSKNKKEMYFKILKSDPRFPSFLSANAKALLQSLLKRNVAERLGTGPEDAQPIRRHPFFEGMDWDALLEKQIPAPFVPTVRETDDTSNFDPAFTKENPELSPDSAAKPLAGADEFVDFTFMKDNPMGSVQDDHPA